ncbi:hypothetical protein BDB01DRAFT_851945 [Pilobolus umbonatus]|nr:hypothetical protein BDB01DRAFT_851945 [Pilobolus umbonatus]
MSSTVNSDSNSNSNVTDRILVSILNKLDDLSDRFDEHLLVQQEDKCLHEYYASTLDEFNDKVSAVIRKYNNLDKRYIIKVPKQSKVGFVPKSKTNSTPYLQLRIRAAMDEHREEGDLPMSDTMSKRQWRKLVEMANEIRGVCQEDSFAYNRSWAKMKKNYRLYYCLYLEQKALRKGIYIYRCNDQWAADRLLSEAFSKEVTVKNARKRRTNALISAIEAENEAYL